MSKFQPVRGTHDLLPEDFRRHGLVIDTAREVARVYGYDEIATPIFEVTDVFARSMGESSDVVAKEMYSFEDKGGDHLTLRPEYTAGVCRAFISNGLQQHLPVKVFAHGPMFRYERPQKGRLRQFHQIDIELLGAGEPEADVEVIALGADILDRLGVLDKCALELNSIGDGETRTAYRAALVAYYEGHLGKLSEDSKRRLAKNPLRILDSKDEGDKAINVHAPLITEYYSPAAREYFENVRQGLDDLGIAYIVNPRLVRGLDYYTHTAFEFVTTALGAQGAVIAGGRYDGLIAELGGPPTPGIGWAGGIERLAMLTAKSPTLPPRPVALVPLGGVAERQALPLAHALRRAGIAVDLAFRGNMQKRLKRANKVNAHLAVILGENELAQGVATVKDLDSGDQASVPLRLLTAHLLNR